MVGQKKNSTQPNSSHKSNLTQPTWVRLNPWVRQIIIIIIIIIKLSRKKYKYKYIKKKPKISINVTP